jgi:hypothetical protein
MNVKGEGKVIVTVKTGKRRRDAEHLRLIAIPKAGCLCLER